MRRRSMAVDAGVALFVLAATLGVLAAGGLGTPAPEATDLDPLGVVLVVVASLPLVARRRAPLWTYVVVAGATATLLGLRYPVDFPFGCVIAVYTIATTFAGDDGPMRRAAAVSAAPAFVAVAAAIDTATRDSSRSTISGIAFWAVAFATAWLAGTVSRLRHERVRQLEVRAARAERETERERQLAAAEERIRIARELHDSAGHAINAILIQAGAARLLHERDPDRSRDAVATIERIARHTIGEIDGFVHALREAEDDQPAVPADPAAIEELLERHRADGLRIETEMTGRRLGLPRTVAWAAYRILQESLTNAARHGAGSANVLVNFGRDAVEISVTNPTGPAVPSSTGGHGILGMRERATMLGGALEATTDHGMFRLRALLPYEEALR